MPLIETARGPIWYADHRREDAIPLMLIHGAGASHLDFPPDLRRLKTASVLLPDLPGHGKSPGEGRSRVEDYAADMIALLDALEITQIAVAGHSMGGAVAQMLTLTYPDRISGLILIGTGAKLKVNDAILNGITTKTRETAELIMKWAWAKSASDEMRQMGVDRLLLTDPQITRGDYLACNQFDVRDRLNAIQVPTLVIGGEVDKMTPPAWSEFLGESIAGAELHLLPDAGHMMTLEQPGNVTGIIRDWLAANLA